MREILEEIIKVEPFIGEDGFNYKTVTTEISIPRKTYLKGTIQGKYRGDRIEPESDLFDFEIYEAEVFCDSKHDFSKNKPFVFPRDFINKYKQATIKGTIFPKEKLPQTLAVAIMSNESSFGVNVLEPQLFEFNSIRKYHQTEGDEVFGKFNAYITGYVFDYEKEIVEKIVGPIIDIKSPNGPIEKSDTPSIKTLECKVSNIKTGETQTNGNYTRTEYFCKNHNHKIWSSWKYNKNNPPAGPGWFSSIVGIIGLIFGVIFLLTILPGIFYFIGFLIIVFLIGILGPYLKWIVRIIGLFLLIGFISSLVNTVSQESRRFNPAPIVVDKPREVVEERTVITDETIDQTDERSNVFQDTLITRYRIWHDYEGKKYEGKYQIRLSDLKKAKYYKENLTISQANINSYDKIIYSLKENDKNKLNGLYKLFDSINTSTSLSKVKFAEMVVSFVQDIPYALILDSACNPNLYNDTFTRQYLSDPNASCDGFQRFGINTPIEFLASLKGDCDSRTLLLYTIFTHYNFDVAILSSEFYSHSILGINLPINGIAYTYNQSRYVMWETTAPNCKPGIIPNNISNLNNWRISLKSK